MLHRLSSIGLSLVTAALLYGCNQERPQDPPTARPLAKEGEFCGGIAGFQCETGLTCKYDGNYPDAGGTCVKE